MSFSPAETESSDSESAESSPLSPHSLTAKNGGSKPFEVKLNVSLARLETDRKEDVNECQVVRRLAANTATVIDAVNHQLTVQVVFLQLLLPVATSQSLRTPYGPHC